MIDLESVERLIEAVDKSSLDSVEIERGGTRVRLAKTPPPAAVMAAAPPPVTASATEAGTQAPAGVGPDAAGLNEAAPGPAASKVSNLKEITSPMVGTFYRSPAPDAPPYVEKGARVSVGDTLCIIEAMKLMNELESEVEGTIVEILVENAQPVEYGQVLFRVDPL